MICTNSVWILFLSVYTCACTHVHAHLKKKTSEVLIEFSILRERFLLLFITLIWYYPPMCDLCLVILVLNNFSLFMTIQSKVCEKQTLPRAGVYFSSAFRIILCMTERLDD